MSRNWMLPSKSETEHRLKDEKEELFVFGYGCKLFRDDEKALFLDRGSHLIPWMGDDKILIDRYDGRGHLFDLSPYDASNVKDRELSEEEKEMEKLCDEERYLELRTDIQEKMTYEEEEWKRYYESLSEGYNAVGFSYDYHQQQQQAAEYAAYQKALRLEEAKPFIVPKELHLPPNIVPPDTDIINARIEKTAKFVASHGAQMEILIKTKQSNNEQFNFLHFDDKLNPYYKHMVTMIKSGKYKPQDEKKEDEESPEKDDNDYSLHPSLMSVKRVTTAPEPVLPQAPKVELPKVSIHDTPYGKLIKTLQKSKEKTESASKPKEEKPVHTDAPPTRLQTPPPPPIRPPPIPPFLTQTAYGAMHSDLPPPPGLEPVTLPPHNQLPHNQPPPPGTDIEETPYPPRIAEIQTEEEDDRYSESSRISPITTVNQIVPPPPDVQPVIDRMAMYVAKNGIEFEIVVKSKSDPRFEFLLPHHVHYPYYNFKKELHMREAAKERERKESEKPAKLSFSIKTKTKEADPPPRKKKKRVFDNESSDDDGDSSRDKSSVSGTSTPLGSDSYQMLEEKPQIPQEEREKKLAEERLKDRLAQAARDKLAQASKEKQMQAERKRKAAMFLNMLKSCNPTPDESSNMSKDGEDGKPSRVSTPGTTPVASPARFVDPDEIVSKTSSKRSRSRSPKRKKKRSSRSPSSKRRSTSRSSSRQRSRSPKSRYSRSPSSSSKRTKSPSTSSKYERDSSSRSSKKSKKKKRSRSPHRKSRSNRYQEVDFMDLTGGDGTISETNVCQGAVEGPPQDVLNDRLPPLHESASNQGNYGDQFSPLDREDSNSNSVASDTKASDSPRNVPDHMLSKVRAIIKASRQAVMMDEESLLDDDT